MVANANNPNFSGGANIAIKCPYHTYEQTIAFYRDTLGLPLIEEEAEGCIFQFGPGQALDRPGSEPESPRRLARAGNQRHGKRGRSF